MLRVRYHRSILACLLLCWPFLILQPHLAFGNEVADISFAQDIQPILSEHCFQCHGPDENTREADLRLDLKQTYEEGEETGLVVARDPNESEIFLRISSTDDDLRMPPADGGEKLSKEQIETVRQWIATGADWQQHWSFVKPKRPAVPPAGANSLPSNEIDHFVLRRLQRENLSPSIEADKRTLIRRVSLDLTGLPPTLEEVDNFLSDNTPGAYERLVDRLLASPRYGEQMAATWLDAARYADSYGYQDDGEATMWRWRDWVIEAFNSNMPFDQFTIEQLAGDLLPNPTLEQRIATGFNRNHRHNSEGGAIPEEFRTEYVIDRVSTTGTVWLGLTLGCARCHDHKFDPITQKEFYELFAFFNSVPEDGRARKVGNTPPLMPAPTRAQQARQHKIEAEIASALKKQAGLKPKLLAALKKWQGSVEPEKLPPFSDVTHDLELHFQLDGDLTHAIGPSPAGKFVNGPDSYIQGMVGQAAELDGNKTIDFGDIGGFSDDNRITITAWIRTTNGDGAILSKIEHPHDPKEKGYSVLLRDGKLRIHLTAQWADDAIYLETQTRVPLDRWTHVAVTYDGLSLAKGLKIYFNGKPQPKDVEFDSLFQGFGNEGSLILGTAGDASNQFQGAIDEVRIYEEQLTESELALLAVKETIPELLKIPTSNRTKIQQHKLRAYFTEQFAAEKFRQADAQVVRSQKDLQEHRRSYPTVMVMEELAEPRPTFLLNRGLYDAPGEQVTPAVPSVFTSIPSDAPRNRLGFARWLVEPDHPLTARVAVNWLWQMSFNRGLVLTAEDFGVQGEWPSHPQLLDWLATELIRTNWDIQAIRRLIVTSSTYRQRSFASAEHLEADPENRLLARGPRFRLSAEAIRDSALYTSGLLVERLGGPSVKPYQPSGLWEELTDDTYERDTGADLYRRSLYMYWKRTVTHPLMTSLNAPSREICTVREERTNSPTQALALMNEEGMVEAARVLAERVLSETQATPSDRLVKAFRLVTARVPREQEITVLQKSLDSHLAHYAMHPEEAKVFASLGEHPKLPHLDPIEVASYATVANMLLNLDEVVTQH